MLSSHTGTKPDLYKRDIDDVAGAASCSEEDLRQFLEFASSFHPNLEYTWSVSTEKLPFLDIYIYITKTQIATPTSTSAHPIHPVANHPYLIVSFLDCVKSAVKTMTLTSRQQKWRPSW